MARETLRPEAVTKLAGTAARSPPTRAQREDGLGAGEAGERGVSVRVAQGDDFKGERLRRNGGDAERGFPKLIVLGRQGFAVERKTLKRQAFAIEHEGAPARRHLGVGAQSEFCGAARRLRVEGDVELDLLDEIIGGGVVFEEFGLAAGLVHGPETIPSPRLLEGKSQNAKPEACAVSLRGNTTLLSLPGLTGQSSNPCHDEARRVLDTRFRGYDSWMEGRDFDRTGRRA